MKLIINRPENWPILKNNQKIYIISPAFGNSEEEILKIKEFLENWNLEGIFYQTKEKNDLEFLANNDNERLNEFKNATNRKESEIIFCSRGGYGSSRIIKKLLQSENLNSKLLLGFSDATSLHLAFNNCQNIPTLHGPMLKQMAFKEIDQNSIDFLYNILTKEKLKLSYDIESINEISKNIKNTKLPKLLGGNLSLIQTSISTDWQINKNGDYSMLIEEINEKPYAIDRMLNHLENANIFNNCKAIFIGDIILKNEKDEKKYLKQILDNFAKKLDIPIFRIKNIGHGRINLAIPLGVDILISDNPLKDFKI